VGIQCSQDGRNHPFQPGEKTLDDDGVWSRIGEPVEVSDVTGISRSRWPLPLSRKIGDPKPAIILTGLRKPGQPTLRHIVMPSRLGFLPDRRPH
jgi:hypothetical protein